MGTSPAEAVVAAKFLFDLLKHFQFTTPARARGIWLSALLTRLARGAIDGECPMFVSRANTPGAGKGLLWNLIGFICDGRAPGKTAHKVREEHFNDEIVSTLMRGPAMTVIDNVPEKARLDSATLACVLTTPTYDARAKGGAVQLSLPVRTLFFATGNGLRLSGEIERRSLVIDMEVRDTATPWERTDLPKIEQMAKTGRAEYLSAAMTILRAWHEAGRPTAPTKCGCSYP